MDYVLQVFGDIKLSSIIIFIAAIAFLFVVFKSVYKTIVTKHDQNQEREDVLDRISKSLDILSAEQQEMKKSITMLSAKQDEFGRKQDEFEKNRRDHDLNKLRDKLLQSYRFYNNQNSNPLLSWTSMEKETFDNLFSDYENMGGNGFMHTVVLPAMENLTVIDIGDVNKVAELAASRQQK